MRREVERQARKKYERRDRQINKRGDGECKAGRRRGWGEGGGGGGVSRDRQIREMFRKSIVW